jgi:hypothetical protein
VKASAYKGKGVERDTRRPTDDVADVSAQIANWRLRTGKTILDLSDEARIPRAYAKAAGLGVKVPYWVVRRILTVVGVS